MEDIYFRTVNGGGRGTRRRNEEEERGMRGGNEEGGGKRIGTGGEGERQEWEKNERVGKEYSQSSFGPS